MTQKELQLAKADARKLLRALMLQTEKQALAVAELEVAEALRARVAKGERSVTDRLKAQVVAGIAAERKLGRTVVRELRAAEKKKRQDEARMTAKFRKEKAARRAAERVARVNHALKYAPELKEIARQKADAAKLRNKPKCQ
jgi:hypothetical protein